MKNSLSSLLLCILMVLGANANTYLVTNTNDSGDGSLRDAIDQANANPGTDLIRFNIPGAGPHEIVLQSQLPFVTDPAHIDGYSQPGATLATANSPALLKIALNGTPTGVGSQGLALGDDCRVRGLAIYSFDTAINMAGNDNIVAGCHIGLDVTGMIPIGNAFDGIIVTGQNNRIGGTTPSQRNVISGNNNGVAVFPYAPDNVIRGNYIGTDATGNTTISDNGFDGIGIGSSNNRILDNVVVGHENNNVLIGWWFDDSPFPENNLVQNNRIGHHANGSFSSFTNNCQGISINMASKTRVRSNIIFGNGCHGVLIDGDAATGNLISTNSIFGNTGIAINLGLDWVTANDPGDVDEGPNRLQNFPVLEEARVNPSKTKVKGFIDTPNPETVTLEFYANPAPHPTGHGDGETLIGTASPKGNGKIRANLPPVAPGTYISAIAIDSENNTSEFSLSIQATGQGGKTGNNLSANLPNKEPEESIFIKAFPNPFSGRTTLSYQLSEGQRVKVSVFDATGQLVRVLSNTYQEAGFYRIPFEAERLPAGSYFYQLMTNGKIHSGKIVLE